VSYVGSQHVQLAPIYHQNVQDHIHILTPN